MSKSELRLAFCSHEAAKYACEKWHYSKCVPKSKISKIGVWENKQFIGVVIFGCGATPDLVKRYGLKMQQGCELVRVALTKHQTEVTRIISIAIRIIKKTYPGLRLIVSFSDPEQGHVGGIYQGGGWIYTGTTRPSDEYILDGKRYQGRSFRNSHKGMEKHPSVRIVKGSSKHRYLYPLDTDMRKQIESLRKPYPKKCAGSIASDAPVIQTGEGGSTPAPALQ